MKISNKGIWAGGLILLALALISNGQQQQQQSEEGPMQQQRARRSNAAGLPGFPGMPNLGEFNLGALDQFIPKIGILNNLNNNNNKGKDKDKKDEQDKDYDSDSGKDKEYKPEDAVKKQPSVESVSSNSTVVQTAFDMSKVIESMTKTFQTMLASLGNFEKLFKMFDPNNLIKADQKGLKEKKNY